MKIEIDTEERMLAIETKKGRRTLPLYSKEAFELLSNEWLRVGWNEKYQYTFSWFGRPVIQLPEDMLRIQEVIYRLAPDVIIETGVAHGGSLIYYASLCKAMEKGRVVGVDLDIRPHNRQAIEAHELFPFITLIEGDSVADNIVRLVKEQVNENEVVLVILDSNHSRDHVLNELEAYSVLVTPGSYIVATDGVMQDLADVPRGEASWIKDNPVAAVETFLNRHPEFKYEQPAWPFNESKLDSNITHWPRAWLLKTE
jgi:cephalosporin hydroxylase